jgi:hypothetical protein
MGMGDAKLGVVIGMVFGAIGLRYVGVAVAGAILFGGLGGIVALVIGRDRKSSIPFGPYMAAGAVIAAFWGQQIADWYLRDVRRRLGLIARALARAPLQVRTHETLSPPVFCTCPSPTWCFVATL